MAERLMEARRREGRVAAAKGLASLAVIALVGGGIAWAWPTDREVPYAIVSRFENHLDGYGETRFRAQSAGELHVVGKVLPIESYRPTQEPQSFQVPERAWRIHSLYNELPDELVASEPAEVGTVARVECTRNQLGIYVLAEDGDYHFSATTDAQAQGVGNAYQWECELELVDLAARQSIGRRTFLGELPSETTTTLGVNANSDAVQGSAMADRTGEAPRVAMTDFLVNLPRR